MCEAGWERSAKKEKEKTAPKPKEAASGAVTGSVFYCKTTDKHFPSE